MSMSSMMQSVEREMRRERGLVHLQFVGDLIGTPASEVAAGDRLMWNGGSTCTVISVRQVSPKFLEVTERIDSGRHAGEEYTRRMRADRLVACAKPGQKFRRG